VFLESPEKICGIEEMDEELSIQFEDDEIQREDEKREEEREEEGDVEEQREEDESSAAILAQSTRVYMFLLLIKKPFYSISFLHLLWFQSFMIWESQLCHPLIL
jgi:hypothetical protein